MDGEWLGWDGQSIGQIIKGGETLMSEWNGLDQIGLGLGLNWADRLTRSLSEAREERKTEGDVCVNWE